jgi:hypothetical protein
MEAIYSSETSVDFRRTTRRYIPEDITTTAVKTPNTTISFWFLDLSFQFVFWSTHLCGQKKRS